MLTPFPVLPLVTKPPIDEIDYTVVNCRHNPPTPSLEFSIISETKIDWLNSE